MRRRARIEVESVQKANILSAYLLARGLKARVDRSVDGEAAVIVNQPLLRTAGAFGTSLTGMVDGWLSDGHATHATVHWRGKTYEVGRLA